MEVPGSPLAPSQFHSLDSADARSFMPVLVHLSTGMRPDSGLLPEGRRLARLSFATFSYCLLLPLLFSCGVRKAPAVPVTTTLSLPLDARGPAALVLPLSAPRWLTFRDPGSEGPSSLPVIPLSDPADADLVPFVPWPHALRSAGLSPTQDSFESDSCTLALQGYGFVVVESGEEGSRVVELRSFPDAAFRDRSVGALLDMADGPTALLYRDSFFLDPVGDVPDPRFLTLNRAQGKLVPFEFPCLSEYLPSSSWELEQALSLPDGSWLFKAVVSEEGRAAYLLSVDQAEPVERISAGRYRELQLPIPASSAPEHLRAALAAMTDRSSLLIASILGTGPSPASFAALSPSFGVLDPLSALAEGDLPILRAWGCALGDRAYLLDSRGSLVSAGPEGVVKVRLPKLPEGFAFTGLLVQGELAVATWEEQDDWSVGAAGLLVFTLESGPALP